MRRAAGRARRGRKYTKDNVKPHRRISGRSCALTCVSVQFCRAGHNTVLRPEVQGGILILPGIDSRRFQVSAGKDLTTAPQPAQTVCPVLVVEDCDVVRSLFRLSLASVPHLRVVEADTSAAALQIADQGDHIGILICDLRLPDGLGTALAEQLRARYPGLKILFASGTPIEHWPDAAQQGLARLPADCWEWLSKPFYPRALSVKVGELASGALDR